MLSPRSTMSPTHLFDPEAGHMYPQQQHHRHAHKPRGSSANIFFAGSVIAALVFMYFVSHGLRSAFHHDDAQDTQSCAARLSEQGLDFDGEAPNVNDYVIARRKVYTNMAADVGAKGLTVGGVITQGLTQDDLFMYSSKLAITPILKPLDIPVRAMVLPILDKVASRRMKQMIDRVLVPVLPPGSLWLQDSNLYHATLYHASSHAKPVPATPSEIAEEERLIKSVTTSTCPISATLERVIITSSGVVVACWQVLADGSEPAELRRQLGQTLLNAPSIEGQMVKEPSMLHTTVARLLLPPGSDDHSPFDSRAVVQAVQTISESLCGLHTMFKEVWFVEELDLLALALDGRYLKHHAPLECPRG